MKHLWLALWFSASISASYIPSPAPGGTAGGKLSGTYPNPGLIAAVCDLTGFSGTDFLSISTGPVCIDSGIAVPGAWTDYSGTITTTHLSGVTITTARWQKVGKTVYLRVVITATSDGTNPTFSLPAAAKDTNSQLVCSFATLSVVLSPASCYFSTASVMTVFPMGSVTFVNAMTYTIFLTSIYEGA
jgi:hypothetical protein